MNTHANIKGRTGRIVLHRFVRIVMSLIRANDVYDFIKS